MPDVELQVTDEERAVLLSELDGLLETTRAMYHQIGRDWDPGSEPAPTSDAALVVAARDQLAGEGPWQLQGDAEQLGFLLDRLRASAELALERGSQPSPGDRTAPMRTADAEGSDHQLDVLRVCSALIARLG